MIWYLFNTLINLENENIFSMQVDHFKYVYMEIIYFYFPGGEYI